MRPPRCSREGLGSRRPRSLVPAHRSRGAASSEVLQPARAADASQSTWGDGGVRLPGDGHDERHAGVAKVAVAATLTDQSPAVVTPTPLSPPVPSCPWERMFVTDNDIAFPCKGADSYDLHQPVLFVGKL